MADLNKTDIVSKTFSLELDTGQTKNVPIRNSRGRTTGQRSEPITIKVPKLSTISSYDVAEDGTVSNVNSKVRQVITKAEYDSLPNNVRTTQEKTIPVGGTTISRTEYYAVIATRDGETGKYAPTDAVDKVLPKNTATLFKKDIANGNEGKQSQFLTVSAATQQKINEEEGGLSIAKNKTGLSPKSTQALAEVQDPPNTGKPPDRAIEGINVRGRTEEDSYGILRYPENLSDTQDYIQFTMFEYGVKEPSSKRSGDLKVVTGFGKRKNKDLKGSVTLPIQNQITDQNRVDWGAGDINPLQAFMAESLYRTDINNIAAGVDDALATARSALKRGGDDIANYVRTYFIQQAIQNKNLSSRMTGAILNPNVELLFNRPQLRPFSFRFFLAARSDTEAIQVKKIIRFFKQGMSVKETKTDIFLKAPNIFKIKYRYGKDGTDHPGLNRIKECALTSCSVDYTPNNSYMTFEDGTMTAYAITLQFQELEPITETDYIGTADGIPAVPPNEIGF